MASVTTEWSAMLTCNQGLYCTDQTLNAGSIYKKVHKRAGGDDGVFMEVVDLELALNVWAAV